MTIVPTLLAVVAAQALLWRLGYRGVAWLLPAAAGLLWLAATGHSTQPWLVAATGAVVLGAAAHGLALVARGPLVRPRAQDPPHPPQQSRLRPRTQEDVSPRQASGRSGAETEPAVDDYIPRPEPWAPTALRGGATAEGRGAPPARNGAASRPGDSVGATPEPAASEALPVGPPDPWRRMLERAAEIPVYSFRDPSRGARPRPRSRPDQAQAHRDATGGSGPEHSTPAAAREPGPRAPWTPEEGAAPPFPAHGRDAGRPALRALLADDGPADASRGLAAGLPPNGERAPGPGPRPLVDDGDRSRQSPTAAPPAQGDGALDQPLPDQPHRDQPHRDQPHRDQPNRDQPNRDQPNRDQPNRARATTVRRQTLLESIAEHSTPAQRDSLVPALGRPEERLHGLRVSPPPPFLKNHACRAPWAVGRALRAERRRWGSSHPAGVLLQFEGEAPGSATVLAVLAEFVEEGARAADAEPADPERPLRPAPRRRALVLVPTDLPAVKRLGPAAQPNARWVARGVFVPLHHIVGEEGGIGAGDAIVDRQSTSADPG